MTKYIVIDKKSNIILETTDKHEFYSYVLMNDKKPYQVYTSEYNCGKYVRQTQVMPIKHLSWFIVDIAKIFLPERKITITKYN